MTLSKVIHSVKPLSFRNGILLLIVIFKTKKIPFFSVWFEIFNLFLLFCAITNLECFTPKERNESFSTNLCFINPRKSWVKRSDLSSNIWLVQIVGLTETFLQLPLGCVMAVSYQTAAVTSVLIARNRASYSWRRVENSLTCFERAMSRRNCFFVKTYSKFQLSCCCSLRHRLSWTDYIARVERF